MKAEWNVYTGIVSQLPIWCLYRGGELIARIHFKNPLSYLDTYVY